MKIPYSDAEHYLKSALVLSRDLPFFLYERDFWVPRHFSVLYTEISNNLQTCRQVTCSYVFRYYE